MQEIGTSGSMSGDGKRSVAAWPKLPRPSSTLPPRRIAAVRRFGRDRSEADMPRASGGGRSDENDPTETLAARFAVTHNAGSSLGQCGRLRSSAQGSMYETAPVHHGGWRRGDGGDWCY